MSEIDIFGFIGMNRSVFATFFLCGVLMPLAVVIIAYLFRNFPTVVRAGAMVSALIGVVMLTVSQRRYKTASSLHQHAQRDGREWL
ncbi:MAG: hypothetical protein CM15mP84_02530 [Cellvibrionales bacterium]|nr:MAG: hypothetical protein CM15mP84_02530 [Cellvibrionales bacterium]